MEFETSCSSTQHLMSEDDGFENSNNNNNNNRINDQQQPSSSEAHHHEEQQQNDNLPPSSIMIMSDQTQTNEMPPESLQTLVDDQEHNKTSSSSSLSSTSSVSASPEHNDALQENNHRRDDDAEERILVSPREESEPSPPSAPLYNLSAQYNQREEQEDTKKENKKASDMNSFYGSPLFCTRSTCCGVSGFNFAGGATNNIISYSLYISTHLMMGSLFFYNVILFNLIDLIQGDSSDDNDAPPAFRPIIGLYLTSIFFGLALSTTHPPGLMRIFIALIGVGLSATSFGIFLNHTLDTMNNQKNDSSFKLMEYLMWWFMITWGLPVPASLWAAFKLAGNGYSQYSSLSSEAADVYQYCCSIASWTPPYKTLEEWRDSTFEQDSPDGKYRRFTSSCFGRLWLGLHHVSGLHPLIRYGPIFRFNDEYRLKNVPLELATGVMRPPLPPVAWAGISLSLSVCVCFAALVYGILNRIFDGDSQPIGLYIYCLGIPSCIILISFLVTLSVFGKAQKAKRRGKIHEVADEGAQVCMTSRAFLSSSELFPAYYAGSCLCFFLMTSSLCGGIYYATRHDVMNLNTLLRHFIKHFIGPLYLVVCYVTSFVCVWILYNGLISRGPLTNHQSLLSVISPVFKVASIVFGALAAFGRLIIGAVSFLFTLPFPTVSIISVLTFWDSCFSSFWSSVTVDSCHNNPMLLGAVGILLAQQETKKLHKKSLERKNTRQALAVSSSTTNSASRIDVYHENNTNDTNNNTTDYGTVSAENPQEQHQTTLLSSQSINLLNDVPFSELGSSEEVSLMNMKLRSVVIMYVMRSHWQSLLIQQQTQNQNQPIIVGRQEDDMKKLQAFGVKFPSSSFTKAAARKINNDRHEELRKSVYLDSNSSSSYFTNVDGMVRKISFTKVQRRWWLMWYLLKFPFLQKERKHYLKRNSYAS